MPPKTINQLSGMPQMVAAFQGWMSKITIGIITQTVVDNFTQDTQTDITFQGTVQPLSPRQIALKPEGQRAWEWLQIHCFSGNLNLHPNDRIIYNSEQYKVMADNDYSLNNYIEYHLVRDYDNA